MNKARRKQIESIMNRISEAKSDLEMVQDDEQSAFDNLTDSLQQTERGQQMEETISELADIVSNLEDIESGLNDILMK